MSEPLHGMKIAIVATDGFEQSELLEPKKALETAGAETEVIAPHSGEIRGWNKTDWGNKVKVDKTLSDARVEDYDALVLPGGVMNPDHLRMDEQAVQFVREFATTERPVAAICHGPWTLVEAGAVKGRTFTSWPSLKTDLKNAGATWVDEEVVVSGQFISSRKPDDIPAFTKTLIQMLEENRKKRAA
ncbi:MAG: type 1 glutamine amidotransferase domain-containing protein [Acidobacteriaceae bacterium]